MEIEDFINNKAKEYAENLEKENSSTEAYDLEGAFTKGANCMLNKICEWLDDNIWDYIQTKSRGSDVLYKGFRITDLLIDLKMTKEKEKLLELDISYRLPFHRLIVKWGEEDFNVLDIGFGRVTLVKPLMSITSGSPLIHEVKPYLRPMSSMTKEECIELGKIDATFNDLGELLPNIPYYIDVTRPEQIDWLNSHMFDYRGLIEQGIALKAKPGMYE